MRNILLFFPVFFFIIILGKSEASEIGTIDIHGFISQGFLQSSDNNYMADTKDGTFEFSEMGLNVVTWVSPGLRVGTQFFARDLGAFGNDEITLDWAYADYQWRDWLGVRVGRQKVNMGLYNTTRDMDMLRTSILMPAGVYNETWRDAYQAFKGIGFYGNRSLHFLGSVSYIAQVGYFGVEADGGVANAFRSAGLIDAESIDSDTTMTFHVRWDTPLNGLKFCCSLIPVSCDIKGKALSTASLLGISEGAPFEIKPDYQNNVFSLEYTLGDLVLATEYSSFAGDITGGPLNVDVNTMGYYYSLAYRFTEWLEVGAYYSVFYGDKNDKDGKSFSKLTPQPNMLAMLKNPPSWFLNEYLLQPAYNNFQKDASLSFRFDLNENWLVKLEGHAMNGAYGADPLNNLPRADEPHGTVQRWFLFAAKVSFNF